MERTDKHERILDALQSLLEEKNMQDISVSEIAQKAGIGKGSIYYYYPSKNAIFDALIERNYEKPLQTAKNLEKQTDVSPFTRMAMIFQACRTSALEVSRNNVSGQETGAQEKAFLHQKYITHIVQELKPTLTSIINQGIEKGEIHFSNPQALAEISLIVLTVKLDNTIVPSSQEDIENTIKGLVELLEKGTENLPGSLNFLTAL